MVKKFSVDSSSAFSPSALDEDASELTDEDEEESTRTSAMEGCGGGVTALEVLEVTALPSLEELSKGTTSCSS